MPQGSSAVRPTNGLYLYLFMGKTCKRTRRKSWVPFCYSSAFTV